MPSVIVGKIDCTKIDKSRLFPGKNGAKYLDVVLIPTTNDRYGNDYLVSQSVSKEEREKGVKGAILGNAKILGGSGKEKPANARETRSEGKPDDGCPF